MEISVIASGSNGNCCLIEDKTTSVLIDVGKSCKEIERRMNVLGKSLDNVDAMLITHNHHDHTHGADVISRRYNIPVYVSDESECMVPAKNFHIGKAFKINNTEILPVATSHNIPSCGFVIGKFGLFTDTGIVTKEMQTVLPKLKGVLLESNHDIDMVINGRYPPHLKHWILSDIGHLSNIHASMFLQEKSDNLSLALLGHLSGNNNTPEMAKIAFETLVKKKIDFHICSRDKESGSFVI
jgi:phosphoribosyl 1,2-cyclic phosphodiesterase